MMLPKEKLQIALQFLNKQFVVITNNELHLQKSPVEKILFIIWQQKENASIQKVAIILVGMSWEVSSCKKYRKILKMTKNE